MTWFPGYRVVVFNAAGQGFEIFTIDASNDAEALSMAYAQAQNSAFELWDAAVMLGRYDRIN